MRRRKPDKLHPLALDLSEVLGNKLRPPFAIVLGAPQEAAELAASLPAGEVCCYQLGLFQADRLRDELLKRGLSAQVVASADLWDLPADFQTALYPAPSAGE